MTIREKWTFEQWQEFGHRIKDARTHLLDAHLTISNQFGKSHITSLTIEKSIKDFEILRSKLDDMVFEKFPERSSEELASVFYGQDQFDIKWRSK